MYIEDREKLQNTWHENMSDIEKDIYFTKMEILTMRQCREDDRVLTCHFGLRDSIISMNKFHKSREKYSMGKLEKLMHDGK